MIRLSLVVLPLLLAGYTILIQTTLGIILATVIATALSITGAAFKKYPIIVAGSLLFILSYMVALTLNHTTDFWGAMGFGLGIFLKLEIGYDWTKLFQRSVNYQEYRWRLKHIILTVLIAIILAYTVMLFGINLAARINDLKEFQLFLTRIIATIIILISVTWILWKWILNHDLSNTNTKNMTDRENN